jgi:hypothetical protein
MTSGESDPCGLTHEVLLYLSGYFVYNAKLLQDVCIKIIRWGDLLFGLEISLKRKFSGRVPQLSTIHSVKVTKPPRKLCNL